MLRTASKGLALPSELVTPDEDRLLRLAFGRFGGRAEARAAAAEVVGRYQQLEAGRWFLCDCLPVAAHPPALVPVSQTHIRRHEDGRWPVHAEACDFYREPEEQRAITASHRPASAALPLRLVRPLGRVAAAPDRRIDTVSHHTSRPGIARLLVQLVTEAGHQAIEAGWRPPSLVDQVKALWVAARGVELDAGVMLPEFFCTSPARLGELAARIAATPAARFKRTRPHGVLVVRVAAIGKGTIQPVSGEPIAVRGRLAVFGERVEGGREAGDERAARAPWLAACVVGRAAVDGPVEVLSAYAHPCAGDAHLMLVDSDRERRTLAQLRSVQAWLGGKKGVAVSIEKPLYDVCGEGGPADVPRPPCIPDFVVRSAPRGSPDMTVIAETMGFADDGYRSRKIRTHAMMAAALGGAAVIEHDFHQPPERGQDWRDAMFWREVRWALTGPEVTSSAGS